MSVYSSQISKADDQSFEMLNTRYYGKDIQVSLVSSLAGIEAGFTPDYSVSHMRYINESSIIARDVAEALDGAVSGDSVVLLCANLEVFSQVRDFLQPAT